jgi:hypothetical protein
MTHSRGRIVLILGMHRSGTSMLARLLAACGLPLGTALLLTRPSRDNAHGYWEQAEIVETHEALLDAFDRTWHGPNGARPLADGWLIRQDTVEAKRRLTAIADREVAQAGGLWGFKDPRTLRFLPLWREIIADLALDPVYLLAARAPAAVAASLTHRNRLTRDFAEALWAANTLTLLDAVGGDLAGVVDYDAWFAAPDALTGHLRAVVGLPMAETGAPAPPVAALIEPALRHHHAASGQVRPVFQALHAALVARTPLCPDSATLAPAMRAAAAALNSVSKHKNAAVER